jgi:hypothetical protein
MNEQAPKKTAYSSVRSAKAATSRSSLDLLSLPYPFSQVGLLTASDFVKQAEFRRSHADRGLPMDLRVLEVLHRYSVLTPLFRVDLTPGVPERKQDIALSLTAQHVHTTVVSELLRGATDGRAADPAVEAFHAWPAERRRALWPTFDSAYLYARHQLLGLDVATQFVRRLKPQRQGEWDIVWRLDEADRPNAPTLEALDSWRSLAITLCALDTYYWPAITHQVSHDLTTWRKTRQAFDAADMVGWLGLATAQVEAQAGDMRIDAAFRDDTGDFYDLIRRSSAKAWDTLRGDALNAMDFRLAADILDRFHEEATGSGAPSGWAVPLQHEGLSSPTHSLDAALTDLHLSPFPALVIGVEGETERRALPRVMELLGIELESNWIRIVEYGGTTKAKHLSLLARFAAQPMLGRDLGSGTTLDRPVTRLLVLADAENDYATLADQRRQRKLLLDSIAQEIPSDLRRDLYNNSRRGRLVEIKTWGKFPFEFAHFTDAQLAEALQSIAGAPHPGGRPGLIAAIRRERLTSSPNIDDVNWRGRGRISKPDLADAMWPVLERRIKRAIKRGHKGPAIMQAAIRAYEMATVSWRVSTMLTRR